MSADGTCVITGGNTGIGFAAARALMAAGRRVVITSRDPQKGRRAVAELQDGGGVVEVMSLDLASFESIRRFAGAFLERHDRLEVLINNAGVILSDRRETEEGFEMTFGVNHLGHVLLTELLLDHIVASSPARIINVSSDAHRQARSGLDFADLQFRERYGPFRAYAASKLANVYFTRQLAHLLAGTGVTVNAVHPGPVASRFGRDGDTSWPMAGVMRFFGWLMRTPEEGADTVVWAALDPGLAEVTGKYFADRRERAPSRAAHDDVAARRLWDVSHQLIAAHGPQDAA